MKHVIRNSYWLIAIVFMVACGEPTGERKYADLVKKELAKGTRTDSIFLGIYFGMPSKKFYGHCWDLNKRGIITDGNSNTMVNFKLDTGLKYPATMNFYPIFEQDKIYKMQVEFKYDAWAPWNRSHFSDSLLPDVVKFYSSWYPGNEFIPITDSVKGTIYVKVDGNRRITLGKYNDMLVKADFTDLLIEKKLKK